MPEQLRTNRTRKNLSKKRGNRVAEHFLRVSASALNLARFPVDFMFQMTTRESANLMFHSGISSWGGTRKPARAFTEQGVAMLSSVLRSERAVAVNIEIMRTFVRLRGMLAGHADLVRRLDALEKRYDQQFRSVFDAIRALLAEEARPRKKIGFRTSGST